MAELLDGRIVSAKVKEEVKEKVQQLKKRGITPGLAAVLVGDDPASHVYVKNKVKDCQETGIFSEKILLDKETPEAEVIRTVEMLNERDDIHGIIVQLPLPPHIDEFRVIEAIRPEKDVDGFHPVNQGLLLIGRDGLFPATPSGILKMLDYYGIELEGKKAVVIGRSNIVGKPMAVMLIQRSATVTVCHSRTRDLAEETRQADLLVVAVGRARMVGADMVKEGAVVVDVGINRVDGKLVGDVDFEAVSQKASYITPVPGGVGLMTRAMLLKNTVKACERQLEL